MHWGVTNIEAVSMQPRRTSSSAPGRSPGLPSTRGAAHTLSGDDDAHSTRCASSSPVNSLGHYKPAGAFDDIRGGGLVLPVVRTRLRFERDACMSRKPSESPLIGAFGATMITDCAVVLSAFVQVRAHVGKYGHKAH